MAIAPYVNYIFSALAPFLIRRSIVTPAQIGIIVTAIFAVATLTSRLAGVVVDRRGSSAAVNLLFWLSAISIVLIAVSNSVVYFLVAAVLAGMAHALSHPATNAMVSDWISPRKQGLTVGLKQAGVQMSQFGAGLILPLAAPVIGWRLAVITGLALVVVGIVGMRGVTPVSRSSVKLVEQRRHQADSTAIWMATYALLLGASLQGTNVYLSVYAFEELDLPETTAGLLVGFVGVAGIIARISWGVLVNRFRGMWKPLASVSVLVLASVATFWSAMNLGPGSLVAGVIIFSVGATAVSVLLSLAIIQSKSSVGVGVNSGVIMRGLYAGYMAGPFLFGQLVERWGYSLTWATMAVLALAAIMVAVTGIRVALA